MIEYRDAEGKAERLPALAAELATLKADVIVTAGGTLAALAAKQATKSVPIVFIAVSDPVDEREPARASRVAHERGKYYWSPAARGCLSPSMKPGLSDL